jgi:FKBP-type peptidyl-prolyl cis-trans isomerase FkpA
MRKGLLLAIVSALVFIQCKKKSSSNNAACTSTFSSTTAPANEITAVESYLNNIGVANAVKHPRGFYYTIVKKGAGDSIASPCTTVKVLYKGSLTNGQIFDQTNGTARDFSLDGLIQGWQTGIPLIRRSGSIRLYLPPSLGYGKSASGSIPANSILIFEIELVDYFE